MGKNEDFWEVKGRIKNAQKYYDPKSEGAKEVEELKKERRDVIDERNELLEKRRGIDGNLEEKMNETDRYVRNSKSHIFTPERIKYALKVTKSLAQAARYMGVNNKTFRKYALDVYGLYDEWEESKNKSGKGIPKAMKTRWNATDINEILEGKHPTYNIYQLGKRLLKLGYFEEKCDVCGFDDRRITDFKIPLIIDFYDGDTSNHLVENIRFLCYNCYFINVGNIMGPGTKKHKGRWQDLKASRVENIPQSIHDIRKSEREIKKFEDKKNFSEP